MTYAEERTAAKKFADLWKDKGYETCRVNRIGLVCLPENRDPYLDGILIKFPYVNIGLFDKKDIEIPQFTDEIRKLLLGNASEDFDCLAACCLSVI